MKVEIQENSSDEFPIREPGKTWAIKLDKSYWQEVPVTQYNSEGKSFYIQKNKQRINFNPDAVHSRINFNPRVTSTPLASTSRQDPFKDQAKDKSRSVKNRMSQVEYDNFRDALYESSLNPNDLVNVQCWYFDNDKELQYIAVKCILYIHWSGSNLHVLV